MARNWPPPSPHLTYHIFKNNWIWRLLGPKLWNELERKVSFKAYLYSQIWPIGSREENISGDTNTSLVFNFHQCSHPFKPVVSAILIKLMKKSKSLYFMLFQAKMVAAITFEIIFYTRNWIIPVIAKKLKLHKSKTCKNLKD